MATYSFLSVIGTIVGPGIVLKIGAESGASEEGISIDPNEGINTLTMGADGSGMHSLHANRSGKITLRLLKTSPFNAALQLAYNLQTANPRAHGKNTITVTDINLLDNTVCQKVAFAKKPTLSYGKVGQVMVWEFDAVKIGTLLGVTL